MVAVPSEGPIAAWQQQYQMPDDKLAGSRPELKGLYRPPRNDVLGISIALAVWCTWAGLLYHALFQVQLSGPGRSPMWDILATFVGLEFVNTGLFITTHDAMHGTICFRSRKVNDFIGWVCISCYAWFDYSMLHQHHWEHHNHTGVSGTDPDFHRGNPAFLPWFINFMQTYSTPSQYAKIVGWVALLLAARAPFFNIVMYVAAAPILAAVRLFYFGTYLPHLPPDAKEVMHWPKSHSDDHPAWITFLKCYHFGYHWEHHRFPYAPWWDLPRCKAMLRQVAAQEAAGATPAAAAAAVAAAPAGVEE